MRCMYIPKIKIIQYDISDCKLVILVLWACLVSLIKNDSLTLWKTFIFTCMQKINFIPNFFPEILQRYCKFVWLLCLVALVTLAGQSHQKNSIKFLMFKSMQKSIHHSLLSCDIAKILHICYFEYFMRAWPHASIMIVSTYMFNIFDAFLLAINQLHSILPS